ncbi:hypothetical protein DSLASN_22510 [Desulfoluna limicola]|uniref:Uncharacterized protein n=1 Tax=Desulfoluna limicola TaxID=2810562 RepID=A0ABM7PH56_9BACT|nr:hypothetical protein DSLASN_22510 [Desulfoluna limicola]
MQSTETCRGPAYMKTGDDGMERELSLNPSGRSSRTPGLTLRYGMCDGRVMTSEHLASKGL